MKNLIITTIAIFAIVLVFLFTSHLFLFASHMNIVVGQPISKIYMPEEFRDTLNNNFEDIRENEFIYCIEGVTKNDTITITDWYVPPNIYIINDQMIGFQFCRNRLNPSNILYYINSNEALGTIHSHPLGNCMPSTQDYYTFGRSNDRIMGIICGTDEIAVYSASAVDDKVDLVIRG